MQRVDPLRGERKLVTVLFADLVGSTALADEEDPERTRARLDRFYEAVTEQIARAGGTLEKFAGDAVMAAFGAPIAQEDHAERALHAALWMQQRIDQLYSGDLELRIGVNTGEVVVGPPRHGSSFVSGDTVNMAARLEQGAAPGSILVSERTAALVAAAFEFGAAEQVPAKGKAEGIAARRLLRALSLTRPRGAPRQRDTLVGRDHEWRALRAMYAAAARSPHPRLLTIVGEPGLGKSRLARELWGWLGREASQTVRRTGRCPPFGRAHAYRPIGDILSEQFSIRDDDPPERILGQLGARRILALALGVDVTDGLHPLQVRERFQAAWLEFVAEVAADRPFVLLVEDLHWAEDPLVDLLELTLRSGRGRLLLLATARPEFLERRPRWASRSSLLKLEPLQPRDVRRYLDELVTAEVPEAVHDLLSRAEGNPLFIEELVGALIERGILRRDGEIQVARLPEIALPDSVQAVLASRIDLLPPIDKALLQAAAVVGRVFWTGAVGELLGVPDAHLGLLEQRDLVRRQPGSSLEGETEFMFKHALIREVAYATLTRRERAHLHAAFAAWLERRRGGRDEDASILAHHYAEAVQPEDADLAWHDAPAQYDELRGAAVNWLRRAAMLASGRYELQEAAALLDRAFSLEVNPRDKVEILKEKGRIQTVGFDISGFRRAMEKALELRPERRTAAEIYAMLSFYGLGRPYMWKDLPPREVAEHWLARALELAEAQSEARGFARLAQALADPLHHVDAAQEAYAIGKARGVARLVAGSFEARSYAATEARRYAEACEWADRALEVSPALPDPSYASHYHWSAGFVYLRAGRFAEVPRLAEDAERLNLSRGPHEHVHGVALRALLASASCHWEALAELASEAEAAAAANSDFPCQFNWRTLLMCALGLAQLGRDDEARRLEAIGRASALVMGPAEREAALLRLLLLRGEYHEARRVLAMPAAGGPWVVDVSAARLDALAVLDDRDGVEAEAAAYLEEPSYTQPFALRALGLVRLDVSLLDAALRRFNEMGLPWRVNETDAMATARA